MELMQKNNRGHCEDVGMLMCYDDHSALWYFVRGERKKCFTRHLAESQKDQTDNAGLISFAQREYDTAHLILRVAQPLCC